MLEIYNKKIKQQNQSSTTNNNTSSGLSQELKREIASTGAEHAEFYFAYGSMGQTPKEFAKDSFYSIESYKSLGNNVQEGYNIFMKSFKKAFEQDGNDYY